MRQNLCGLCKSVSIGSESDQDHLQLLTKLSSPDLPVSSPSPVGKDAESQITIQMVSSSVSDPNGTPAEVVQLAAPNISTQTEETSPPQSCPVPTSLFNSCLDMNSSL